MIEAEMKVVIHAETPEVFGDKAKRIIRIAETRQATGGVVSVPAPDAIPAPHIPLPTEDPVSFMEIEVVWAKPGELATVRVFGGTSSDVTGFWFNGGHNESVRLVDAKLGQFFNDHVMKDGKRFDSFRFAQRGKKNSVFDYQLIKITSAASRGIGLEKAILIPPGTELFSMTFQLDADSNGTFIVRHGQRGGGISNRPTIYTSMIEPNGLHPAVTNGGIRVKP